MCRDAGLCRSHAMPGARRGFPHNRIGERTGPREAANVRVPVPNSARSDFGETPDPPRGEYPNRFRGTCRLTFAATVGPRIAISDSAVEETYGKPTSMIKTSTASIFTSRINCDKNTPKTSQTLDSITQFGNTEC